MFRISFHPDGSIAEITAPSVKTLMEVRKWVPEISLLAERAEQFRAYGDRLQKLQAKTAKNAKRLAAELSRAQKELKDERRSRCSEIDSAVESREREISDREQALTARDADLSAREQALMLDRAKFQCSLQEKARYLEDIERLKEKRQELLDSADAEIKIRFLEAEVDELRKINASRWQPVS